MLIGMTVWLLSTVKPLPDVVDRVTIVELSVARVRSQVRSNCPIGGSLTRTLIPPSGFKFDSPASSFWSA